MKKGFTHAEQADLEHLTRLVPEAKGCVVVLENKPNSDEGERRIGLIMVDEDRNPICKAQLTFDSALHLMLQIESATLETFPMTVEVREDFARMHVEGKAQ